MNFILAVFIFSGVIATGNALKCETCKVVVKEGTVNDCVGELVECESATDQCAKQIEENLVEFAPEGEKFTTVKKGCFPSLPQYQLYCGNRFEADSNPKFHLIVYSECCRQDGCNSGPIQMPPRSTTPNGFTCPYCFGEDTTTCTPGTKPCFGAETQCLKFGGFAARPEQNKKNYAIVGCVTGGACLLDFKAIPGSQVYSTNYTCSVPLRVDKAV